MDKTFVFYHTECCHLCDSAMEIIQPYQAHLNLQIEQVDIANDDNLLEQYGTSIPVLKHSASQLELFWPFDEQSLHSYLNQIHF